MRRITSPAELGVAAVAEVHAQLRAAAAGPEESALDLSEVRRLDAAGAQLVLAAVRAGVRLVRPSEAAMAALGDLGLVDAVRPAIVGDEEATA